MAKIPAIVPWEDRPIEFLCAIRFPELYKRKDGWITPSPDGDELYFRAIEDGFGWSPEFRKKVEEAEAYIAELEAMPHEKLMVIFREEHGKWRKERRKKAKAAEKALFFNRPEADADLVHWAKMPLWTLEEAVALSLGKDPKLVNYSNMSNAGKRFAPAAWLQSEFAKEFARRAELVQRAKVAGMLSDQVTPERFIHWAVEVFDKLPDELIAKFVAPPKAKDAESLAGYPPELRAAIEAYRAVSSDPNALSGRSPRQALERWLSENRPEIVGLSKKRVLTVANWSPKGGAPKTPGGEPTPGG